MTINYFPTFVDSSSTNPLIVQLRNLSILKLSLQDNNNGTPVYIENPTIKLDISDSKLETISNILKQINTPNITGNIPDEYIFTLRVLISENNSPFPAQLPLFEDVSTVNYTYLTGSSNFTLPNKLTKLSNSSVTPDFNYFFKIFYSFFYSLSDTESYNLYASFSKSIRFIKGYYDATTLARVLVDPTIGQKEFIINERQSFPNGF